MSVNGLRIELPIRVCWWLKWVADREKMTPEGWVERLVLQKLDATPGVDLHRSPRLEE